MIKLAKNKEHLVIKRDGSLEPYDPEKMYKVVLWACQGNEVLAKSILDAIDIKIYNKIPISVLFDEVIDTTLNLISRMYPEYEEVAKRLFIQKMYKETFKIKRNEYPPYKIVLKNLIAHNQIIDIFKYFTEEEIDDLGSYIKPERDFNSTYLGLNLFFNKYAKKINNKPAELLQHGFMRMAIQAFIYEPDKRIRIEAIKKRYDDLSTFVYTEATPKWINSLTSHPQMASCVLHQIEDSSYSINKVCWDINAYSKYAGGNAVDISPLRAAGSSIGSIGVSSGPIPFIKMIESGINAFNQLGARRGACVVTFPWWHKDVMSLLELKDEGGMEQERARNLQYSIKINRIFLRRVQEGKDVTLFDPKEARELLYTTNAQEFDNAYRRLEKNGVGVKISARDIAYKIAQIRAETGNLYIFFVENANENTPFKDPITQSNLCQEIALPTKATKLINKHLYEDITTKENVTYTIEETGWTALCNLSSINVAKWMDMSREERDQVAYNLLKASDNLIEWAHYPTKEGELFNKGFRPLGIGMNNLAYYFAREGVKFTDPKAKELMEEICLAIKHPFRKASKILAQERGAFKFIERTDYVTPFRFATLFAIAPTSTSSHIAGATEGIEPVTKLVTEKTGTYSYKQIVPELKKYGSNYQLAYEIPPKTLYDLAAIRQNTLLDQAQSINTYMKNPRSAYEIIQDIIYAEQIGLKSLYYLKSENTESINIEEECDSCQS